MTQPNLEAGNQPPKAEVAGEKSPSADLAEKSNKVEITQAELQAEFKKFQEANGKKNFRKPTETFLLSMALKLNKVDAKAKKGAYDALPVEKQRELDATMNRLKTILQPSAEAKPTTRQAEVKPEKKEAAFTSVDKAVWENLKDSDFSKSSEATQAAVKELRDLGYKVSLDGNTLSVSSKYEVDGKLFAVKTDSRKLDADNGNLEVTLQDILKNAKEKPASQPEKPTVTESTEKNEDAAKPVEKQAEATAQPAASQETAPIKAEKPKAKKESKTNPVAEVAAQPAAEATPQPTTPEEIFAATQRADREAPKQSFADVERAARENQPVSFADVEKAGREAPLTIFQTEKPANYTKAAGADSQRIMGVEKPKAEAPKTTWNEMQAEDRAIATRENQPTSFADIEKAGRETPLPISKVEKPANYTKLAGTDSQRNVITAESLKAKPVEAQPVKTEAKPEEAVKQTDYGIGKLWGKFKSLFQ